MLSKSMTNGFTDILMDRAHKDFVESEGYEAVQLKLDAIDEIMENEFMPSQEYALEDLLGLLDQIGEAEKKYLYRRGFQDCVQLLGFLHIL